MLELIDDNTLFHKRDFLNKSEWLSFLSLFHVALSKYIGYAYDTNS